MYVCTVCMYIYKPVQWEMVSRSIAVQWDRAWSALHRRQPSCPALSRLVVLVPQPSSSHHILCSKLILGCLFQHPNIYALRDAFLVFIAKVKAIVNW